MKITHISDIDMNAKAGGMNTIIPLLIELQMQANIDGEVVLLLTNDTNSTSKKIKIYNRHSDYKTLLKESDLVVFHSVYNLRFIPLYWYIKKHKIPYIIVAHGAFSRPTQEKGKAQKFIFRNLFLNKFVKDALAVSYLTEDEQKNSFYPNKKYIVVPNVIDKESISCIDSINLDSSLQNEKLNIVFMSKIDYHHKGIDLLIDTLIKFKAQLLEKKVKFTLYGYGKSKDIDLTNIGRKEKDVKRLIKDIKKNSLENLVEFRGPVFGIEKKHAIQNTDIMILPSRLEGMPLTIIEFLGCGIPCIITKETNMGEIIKDGNCGWVSDFDSDSLGKTIIKAIEEYKNNPYDYKKNAYDTFLWINSIEVGNLSIKKYRGLLKSLK